MPKAANVRIGLARRPAFLAAGLALVAVTGVAAWWFINRPDSMVPADDGQPAPQSTGRVQPETGVRYATTEVELGGKTYRLDIADTPQKQTLGLGKRVDLPPDQGMVFVYKTAGQRCFWMKDMGFPIDIIWLDNQQRVVTIESELSPDTYPKTFCPASDARYVVELYPGTAAKTGLKVGDTFGLKL